MGKLTTTGGSPMRTGRSIALAKKQARGADSGLDAKSKPARTPTVRDKRAVSSRRLRAWLPSFHSLYAFLRELLPVAGFKTRIEEEPRTAQEYINRGVA